MNTFSRFFLATTLSCAVMLLGGCGPKQVSPYASSGNNGADSSASNRQGNITEETGPSQEGPERSRLVLAEGHALPPLSRQCGKPWERVGPSLPFGLELAMNSGLQDAGGSPSAAATTASSTTKKIVLNQGKGGSALSVGATETTLGKTENICSRQP